MLDSIIGRFRPDGIEWTDTLLDRPERVGLALVGVICVAFGPVAAVVDPFLLNVFTRMFLFALLALSLDFVFGYSGLPSFGHAAMFGAGGFASAFLLLGGIRSASVVLFVAFATGFTVAAIIGWLSVHTKDVYFAMVTLAFAQILYIAAFNDIPAAVLGVDSVTGGDNGLTAIPPMVLLGFELNGTLSYYFLSLAVIVLSFIGLVRVANSPYGRVLQGIAENERRATFVGYDARRYKISAFAISGGVAGVAGGLYVPFQTVAHAHLLNWTVSGNAIIMTLVGGMGTLWGPMLGGAFVIFLEYQISGSQGWRIALGLVFIVIVLFMPEGIAGVVRSGIRNPRSLPERVRQSAVAYIEDVRGRG